MSTTDDRNQRLQAVLDAGWKMRAEYIHWSHRPEPTMNVQLSHGSVYENQSDDNPFGTWEDRVGESASDFWEAFEIAFDKLPDEIKAQTRRPATDRAGEAGRP